MTQGVSARAMLLYDQGRYDLAEEQARRWLFDAPDDARGHALLALCLLKRKDWGQAIREVSEAVRLGPDVAYVHYVGGHVLLAAERHEQAMNAANAAVQLDPDKPAHYGLVAAIHLDRRRWRDALAAAERGLAIDPEDVQCNNARGMALVKLGRRAEAGATMARTLAIDPDDAFTHANRGWSLLHESKPKEAMEHFREALRLDPTMDWARMGIVEALKARNFIYRWMLAYFLFMSRMGSRAQWAIIIGGWVGAQALRALAEGVPPLKPYVLPVVIVYAIFAILTWIADPVFNLMLRVSRYGRLALSREQTIAANCIGGTFLVSIGCAIGALCSDVGILIDCAIISFVFAVPLAGLFRTPKGWPRLTMAGVLLVLLGIGGLHVWRMYTFEGFGSHLLQRQWDENQLISVYAKAVLGATILGNILNGVRVKKG